MGPMVDREVAFSATILYICMKFLFMTTVLLTLYFFGAHYQLNTKALKWKRNMGVNIERWSFVAEQT